MKMTLASLKYRTVPSTLSFDGCRAMVQIPYVVQATANEKTKWQKTTRLRQELRAAVNVGLSALYRHRREIQSWPIWDVTLTRIAPRAWDEHDNLRTCLKAAVDEVTAWLGMTTDSSKRLCFYYRQERRAPRTYGLQIEICQRTPSSETTASD